MLLFDSLHMASQAMNAAQLGIQVTGQNLSNSQTAGYVREQLVLETGTSRKLGNGTVVGTGVQISGVTQVIDNFLEERLRSATSDAVSSATREQYYTQLESLLNETTSGDLSSALSAFFNSIDNVLDHPEDVTYRNMTVRQAESLTEDINRVATTIIGMQQDINTTIEQSADEINRLLKEIDELNSDIAMLEGGYDSREALGLRDQRLNALSSLSGLINIKTTEDAQTGKVTIYCGSHLLLMDGVRQEVGIGHRKEEGSDVIRSILCVGDTATPLDVRSGSVYGLYEAQTTILGGYLEKLDDFAANLVREFNAIYSSGQGLTGYTELTSSASVSRPEEPLSEAGLDYSIQNGVFSVQVFDTNGALIGEERITVSVEESPTVDPFSLKSAPKAEGTSLDDIAAAINRIEHLTAKVNSHGELEIRSESSDYQFAFAGDTSGVLAALGMNTFFTGTSATTIGVDATVAADPSKFAASLGGVGHDTDNGVKLAAMAVTANPNLGGVSITQYYDGIVSGVMMNAATTKSTAASDSLYQMSLQTQRDSISGVNIDEETILMMTYQRMFQANSRYVSTINEMLDTLINI